jgi:hypothetical protein
LGSFESKHWSLLLKDRQIINENEFNDLIEKLNTLHKKLNSHIKILKEIKSNI